MSVGRALRWLLLILAIETAAALAGCAQIGPARHPSTAADLARMKMARELTEQGDWGRAFVVLDDLHRQWPEEAEVLTLRGIVYRERGLFHDAEGDLKAALKVAPDDAEAHAALGILYDIQMRPDAEAEHKLAVKLAPQNPAFLNNLGFSLFLRQHYKEAIKEYEKAARLAPLSRRVRTNMGFAYAAVGDLPSAAREFQMGGTQAEAKNNLGYAYERRGDMANAYQLYLDALRIDPAAVHARSNLVHAAAVLGRPVPPEAAPPLPAATQNEKQASGSPPDVPPKNEAQHDAHD